MRITVVVAGTRGDVEPHLALSLALMRRGHDVTLCAPIDFETQARELGVAFRSIRISFRALCGSADGAVLLASDNRPLEFIRALRRLIVPLADQAIRDIGEACAGAELVLYSVLSIPAYYFARELGVPAIATCLQPMGRTRAHASPLYPFAHRLPGRLNHLTHVVAEQLLWQMYRPFLKRRWRSGLPLVRHFSDVYREANPMLFAYSPALVPRPPEYKPWMHVTGSWKLAPARPWAPPAALAEFVAHGTAPVCVGFGSMNTPRVGPILRATLDALAARGRRAIVLTGWWSGADRALRDRRDVYVTESVPHEWLLPRVHVMIHHGGAGTTAAALRAAAPSVIVPFFFDQRFWGSTLRRAQLGPDAIPARHFSRARLERALDAIDASPVFRPRLDAVAAALNDDDGTARAADIVDEAMESHQMRMLRVSESTS